MFLKGPDPDDGYGVSPATGLLILSELYTFFWVFVFFDFSVSNGLNKSINILDTEVMQCNSTALLAFGNWKQWHFRLASFQYHFKALIFSTPFRLVFFFKGNWWLACREIWVFDLTNITKGVHKRFHRFLEGRLLPDQPPGGSMPSLD